MTKNQKGFVVVGVVAALGAAGYYFYHKGNAKAQITQLIDKMVKEGLILKADVAATFEKAYLVQWYNAYQAGQSTFAYNGKTYNVKGGRAIS